MTMPNYQALGTAASGTSGAVSPTIPTHTTGDLIVLAAEGDNTDFGTDPSGYTLVGVVAGTANKISVWYKIAASASETNPTITPTTANHTYAQIITFRNVHQTLPVHARTQGSANTNSVVAALGLSTLVDDCMILQIVGWGVDNAGPLASAEANASLVNLTERQDAGTLDGNGGGLLMYTGEKADDGTVSQTTFTLAASTAVAMMTLALAPIADQSIDGAMSGTESVTDGTEIKFLDVTQPAASYLVADTVVASGVFTASIPYDDHAYIAIYHDNVVLIRAAASKQQTVASGDFDIIYNASGGGGCSRGRIVNQ